ncbi:hypothetical protein HDU83_004191 [Entophlyctis luteolus]|nr:hypothetical protein HDU83_004191 [Entophlyctis luteolus]KAJ3383767.1 hypothetical protein HDU84_003409 [Entophlyctis sp. JEL0112]
MSALILGRRLLSSIRAAARTKTLYVGNLSWTTKLADVSLLFSQHGTVRDVRILEGPDGRSRGFGFVEMEDAEAIKAAENLNGHELDGRQIRVSVAETELVATRKAVFGGGFGNGIPTTGARPNAKPGGHGRPPRKHKPNDRF